MNHDVVIVGGGVMGSSAAYHLRRFDPAISVLVLERDASYRYASTVLSEGNVRIQFNLEENIRISQHTMEVMATFSEDMATTAFRPESAPRREGNLFLVDEAGREVALQGLELQRSLGCDVEWLEPASIAEVFPSLRTEGLAGGTLGRSDGGVDPTAVLRGYRNKAIEMGVEYAETEALALVDSGGPAPRVRTGDGDLAAGAVLVTAGAWTADLLLPIGVDLPVVPVRRTVYVVASTVPTAGMPAVFLPSGAYAIPVSECIWNMAWSLPDDPVGYDFTPASRGRFEDRVWPELVAHLPAFDRLRVETSWAGLYAVNTLDGNAIIGRWPGMSGLYMATGFSGHGFQQAPAVGRHLAESILGLPHALDLSRLGPQRVIDGIPVREHSGRLI
ncbi:MAG: FAD-binding oxidoreductase [Acidimicrobiia bacterium]|nr:MAG: FAD-binding oxidoreductase [Acidimicrobiia bacterium]